MPSGIIINFALNMESSSHSAKILISRLNLFWHVSLDNNYMVECETNIYNTGLILGLRPANERRRYFVTTSLIGWAQNLESAL